MVSIHFFFFESGFLATCFPDPYVLPLVCIALGKRGISRGGETALIIMDGMSFFSPITLPPIFVPYLAQ